MDTRNAQTLARFGSAIGALLLVVSGCGDGDEERPSGGSGPGAVESGTPTDDPTTDPASDPTSASPTVSESPRGVVPLEDGPVDPGRYRFTIRMVCEKGDTIGCPKGTVVPPPLDLEVTVPEGWQHWADFGLLTPLDGGEPTFGPDGAALVMGWTSFHVGLNSDPCLTQKELKKYPGGHETPDIPVGPTVDDFVDAVQANDAYDVTPPSDTRFGRYRARFFELEGPDDLGRCELWRPWDPGFWVQGTSNHWDVWTVDVAGARVLIVAQHFPDTPDQVVDDLAAMVDSIRFKP